MIFNVRKNLYFNAIRGIPCILTNGCFFMGQEGGVRGFLPAHNSRDIKCYFLMIFNVRKKLYFNAIRGIPCILKKGCFLWGRKGGSTDSHRAHNSRDIKLYFLMIFDVRKKLYFKAIRAILCIFTKGCFFMGQEGGVGGFPPGL